VNLGPFEIVSLALIGLAAGTLGGLLGIGGSIIMIPAMAIMFHGRAWGDQHLYQAAAMAVNVAVAVPAALRHRKAGAIHSRLFKIMLPAAMVAIVAGVLVSNLFEPTTLKRIFAAFLIYVVVTNVIKLVGKKPEHHPDHARVNILTGGVVGTVMGFAAGLLGIGGGGIAVPLANLICRVPLRQAIAASAAVMCLTAGVGAAIKIGTLPEHGHPWTQAVVLALILSPTAMLGGHLGASLTHRVDVRLVRAIFTVVIALAAARMAGLL
jgi:uncharacterized membrane protein YfcA